MSDGVYLNATRSFPGTKAHHTTAVTPRSGRQSVTGTLTASKWPPLDPDENDGALTTPSRTATATPARANDSTHATMDGVPETPLGAVPTSTTSGTQGDALSGTPSISTQASLSLTSPLPADSEAETFSTRRATQRPTAGNSGKRSTRSSSHPRRSKRQRTTPPRTTFVRATAATHKVVDEVVDIDSETDEDMIMATTATTSTPAVQHKATADQGLHDQRRPAQAPSPLDAPPDFDPDEDDPIHDVVNDKVNDESNLGDESLALDEAMGDIDMADLWGPSPTSGEAELDAMAATALGGVHTVSTTQRRQHPTSTASAAVSMTQRDTSMAAAAAGTSNASASAAVLGCPMGVPPSRWVPYVTAKGITNLYPWQVEAWETFYKASGPSRRLVYTAPTSGGKTLVADIAMLWTMFTQHRSCVFMLPLVAVVEERVAELRRLAQDVPCHVEKLAGPEGILPPIRRKDGQPTIYVATYEKAAVLVESLEDEQRMHEIGLVCVDEIHELGQSASRGAKVRRPMAAVCAGRHRCVCACACECVGAGVC